MGEALGRMEIWRQLQLQRAHSEEVVERVQSVLEKAAISIQQPAALEVLAPSL